MNNSDQDKPDKIYGDVENTAIDPSKVGGTYKAMRLLIREGITFEFEDGDDKIKFHASGLNGMEIVYFNDEIVSKSRHLTFSSRHIFQKNGHDYEVNIVAVRVLRGELECSVMKDRQLIGRKVLVKGIEVTGKKALWFLLKAFTIGLLVGVTVGFVVDKLF